MKSFADIISEMKLPVSTLLSAVILFMAGAAFADKPDGSVYLDGGNSKTALILAHGRGKHPTWKVVDPLRKGVHEKLGFHTLSLQMPNADKSWKRYADDFPEAYRTIEAAIKYLKQEKHVSVIYIMGHSMGSRMASSFISKHPDQPVAGLIVAGCRNNGGYPLSCYDNLQDVAIPVLDIWGGGDEKDADAAGERNEFLSDKYKQVEVAGANHKFDGYEDEFVLVTVNWLKRQNESLNQVVKFERQ